MTNTLSDCLATHQRANLIQIPAIIHKLPRLSSRLGQEIYVLRDDLTSFGLGGNKTRKVDFLLGDALAKRATTVVTIKATSFSRNAAAGAAACGLDFHVVLPGTESDQNPLSQSVFEKWGASLHYGIGDTTDGIGKPSRIFGYVLEGARKESLCPAPGRKRCHWSARLCERL